MILLFLGPPGSGKGTQSDLLVKNYGYYHISVGDILRAEIKDRTILGLKIKNIIDHGNLVDDSIINDLIKIKLQQYNYNNNNNIIVDGYPRSIVQAKYILNFLDKYNFLILNFNIEKNEIIDRLLYRAQCNNCKLIINVNNQILNDTKCPNCDSMDFLKRKDDSEDIIINRLDNYYKISEQIVDYYKVNKIIYNINASQSKNVVHEEIIKIINKT